MELAWILGFTTSMILTFVFDWIMILTFVFDWIEGRTCKFCKYKFENKFKED